MNKGFSYIELLIALALFSILFAPLLPFLNQAHANHKYSLERHMAQGHAAYLAITGEAGMADNFVYELTRITAKDKEFNTDFAHLFKDAVFTVAEVFDKDGNRLGISVTDIMR